MKRCQECGKPLSNWDESHSLYDCAEWHLKRAQEIYMNMRKHLKAEIMRASQITLEERNR